MQDSQIENMNPKALYQNVLYVRDEMGEMLGNLAAAIYNNPNCLRAFKIVELVRLYEFLSSFSHWCVSANVISMANNWITIRMLELQNELNLDLGLQRQSREQIERRKEEFRKMCGLDKVD
jgi:hypothetical protein